MKMTYFSQIENYYLHFTYIFIKIDIIQIKYLNNIIYMKKLDSHIDIRILES